MQYMLNIHLASLYLIQLAKFWDNLDSKNWTEHGDHLIRIIEVCICAYVCMCVCTIYLATSTQLWLNNILCCIKIFLIPLILFFLQTVTHSASSYAGAAWEMLKSSGNSDETRFVATELVCV